MLSLWLLAAAVGLVLGGTIALIRLRRLRQAGAARRDEEPPAE